jgi:ABC-type antimicrobial peptide transport system permease subunit
MRALAANTLRSILTMLGIIIGVAAVITMIAVGSGATQRVQEQMKGLGSNIMLVIPGGITAGGVRLGAQTGQGLTEDDALAIAREVPEVQVAAPSSRTGAQVVAGNTNWSTSIFGTTNDYLEAREWALSDGRAFRRRRHPGIGQGGHHRPDRGARAVRRCGSAGPGDPGQEDAGHRDRRARP